MSLIKRVPFCLPLCPGVEVSQRKRSHECPAAKLTWVCPALSSGERTGSHLLRRGCSPGPRHGFLQGPRERASPQDTPGILQEKISKTSIKLGQSFNSDLTEEEE